MHRLFAWMAVAAGLHIIEEFVYPGGFLRWLRVLFPGGGPSPVAAFVGNAAFAVLVLAPVFGVPEEMPVVSVSIPILLLANTALHVGGTLVTRRYSPGVVTAVVLYFPLATYTLIRLTRGGGALGSALTAGLVLGVAWQCIPFLGFAASRVLRAR
jgi:uncharacterized protein with HXXEE motif